MQRPRWLPRFRVWMWLVVVALVAFGMMAPDWWCRGVRYWKRKPSLDALERRITIHSPREEGIEGVIERFREATVSPSLPQGLVVWRDHETLAAATFEAGDLKVSTLAFGINVWNATLDEDFDVKDMPAKDVLTGLLRSIGLRYVLSEPHGNVNLVPKDIPADVWIQDDNDWCTCRLLGVPR